MTKNVYTIIFKVLVCTLIMISCGPKSSYNVKSFFFDGVPKPLSTQEIDSILIDTLSIAKQDSIIVLRKPKDILHPPFKDKNCSVCHKKYKRSENMAQNKTLCYSCHDPFENNYQNLHGPVDLGYCTQCHNPHKSKYEGLLTLNDNQLCLGCHEQAYLLNTSIHKTLDDTLQCLTCHNPHGSNTNFLLTQSSCFGCHENYNTKLTHVHGPVAAGLCSNCHKDHNSNQPHLLTNTTNNLCLECHNPKDFNTTSTHQKSKKETCTSCHNPHGGSNHYFLTQLTAQ